MNTEIVDAFDRNSAFVIESVYACMDNDFLNAVDSALHGIAQAGWDYYVTYDLLDEPYVIGNTTLSASVTIERQGQDGTPLEGQRILYRVTLKDSTDGRDLGHNVTNSYQYANRQWDHQDTILELYPGEGGVLMASVAYVNGREFDQDLTGNLRTYHDGVIAIINNAFPSPYAVSE